LFANILHAKLNVYFFAGLMKIMYTLAKKHQSVSSSNVMDFVDLYTDLGADYLTSLRVGANAQYTSERVMQELLDALAGDGKKLKLININFCQARLHRYHNCICLSVCI
jgi:hypothetical protein